MKRNPVLPRMRHIAKTYPDWVAFQTIIAWAEANGRHALKELLEEEFSSRVYSDEGRTVKGTPASAIAAILERELPPEGLSTPFDRHLPWAAKALNADYKVFEKAAKAVGYPHATPDVVGRWPAGGPVGIWAEVELPLASDLYPGSPIKAQKEAATTLELWRAREEAERDAELLLYHLRSISHWAEATGTDLGRLSVEDAVAEANAYWDTHELPGSEISQGEVVYTFPDAWTVQKLTTGEQLADEGEAMQHCVGDAYCPIDKFCPECEVPHHEVSASGYPVEIFSLRDPAGKPHATMEWHAETNHAAQLRGKQNDAPLEPYLRRMVCFRIDYLQPYLKEPQLRKMRQTLGPTAAQFEDQFAEHYSWFQSYVFPDELLRLLDFLPRDVRAIDLTLAEAAPGEAFVWDDHALDEIGSGWGVDEIGEKTSETEMLEFLVWLDTGYRMLTRGGPGQSGDEMVGFLFDLREEAGEYIGRNACELGDSRAPNPARTRRGRTSRRHQELKRKLMR